MVVIGRGGTMKHPAHVTVSAVDVGDDEIAGADRGGVGHADVDRNDVEWLRVTELMVGSGLTVKQPAHMPVPPSGLTIVTSLAPIAAPPLTLTRRSAAARRGTRHRAHRDVRAERHGSGRPDIRSEARTANGDVAAAPARALRVLPT